jgi:hypothetical protein
MDRLLSIVRAGTTLTAFVLESASVFVPPCRRRRSESSGPCRFRIVRRPLSELTRSLYPARDRLLKTWNRLSNAAPHTSSEDLQLVLRETVPDWASKSILLKTETPPPLPKATAANPRAYGPWPELLTEDVQA